jgi:hypothetical protein
MEKEKRKSLTLKELISNEEMKKTLFASLLGDNNGNYNLFRLVIDPKAPEITQRIYANDYGNSY